jgi:hypothetical protein
MQNGIAVSETHARAFHAKQCRIATMRELSVPLSSETGFVCGGMRIGRSRHIERREA